MSNAVSRHTINLRQHHCILQEFLTSKAVRAALNQTGSALAALTVLKKICDHPCLLKDQEHPSGDQLALPG